MQRKFAFVSVFDNFIIFISEYILLIGIIDMTSQCICMLINIHKHSVAFSFFVAVLWVLVYARQVLSY